MSYNHFLGYKKCLSITITATTLLLLLTSIISIEGKPLRKRPQNPAAILGEVTGVKSSQNKTEKLRKAKVEKWWVNPCGVMGGEKRDMPQDDLALRIPHHDPEVPSWITQLKIAIQQLRKIEEMYREIGTHLRHDQFQHGWLPEYPSAWLVKQPVLNQLHAMSELYKGLQRFAVTIECLVSGPDCKPGKKQKLRKRKSDDDEARMRLLNEIKSELQKLLCEVQMIVRDLKKQRGKLPVPPTSVIIDVRDFMTDPDTTGKLVQDWGVLKRYETYLLEWEQIARSLVFKIIDTNPVTTTTTSTTSTEKQRKLRARVAKGPKKQKQKNGHQGQQRKAPGNRHHSKKIPNPLVSI